MNGSRRLRGSIGSEQIDIEVDMSKWPHVIAVIAGREIDVRLVEIGSGVYWMASDGRSTEARVFRHGESSRVVIGDAFMDVRIGGPRGQFRDSSFRGSSRGSEVRAPMPGRVVGVLAGEGEQVRAGQGLLVLEAMKMQNEIRSPRAGVVRVMKARVGASVNSGDLLATLE